MALHSIIWLCIVGAGLLISFFKGPIYALLVYFFAFYTQFQWVHKYEHGGRYSLYISIAMVASYILGRHKIQKLPRLSPPPLKWLILFSANMLLVSFFAVDPEANSEQVLDVFKLFVLYFMIVCIVRTKLHYKMSFWLHLWGCFYFGWRGFNAKLTHGRLEGIGGPSTNTSNSLSNLLIMITPFLNNYVFYGKKWEKIAAIIAAPFILNAIVLCNSRGAFLGLLAIAVLLVIVAEKKIRLRLLIGLTVGTLIFINLANQKFWDRMNTLRIDSQQLKETGELEDGSAQSRLITWRAALQMLGDYPFGAGGDGWIYMSPIYIPEIVSAQGERRAVHNSYLKVATDFGIQGLSIYLLFIGSTILELRRMRKRNGTGDDAFFHTESIAIELAIWGHMVCSTFGSRPYFEPLIIFCALGMALSNIQQSKMNATAMEKNTSA